MFTILFDIVVLNVLTLNIPILFAPLTVNPDTIVSSPVTFTPFPATLVITGPPLLSDAIIALGVLIPCPFDVVKRPSL